MELPDQPYLARIGMVVFLVADLESVLKGDLVRFQSVLPTDLDFNTQFPRLTGKTTTKLGQWLIDLASEIGDAEVGGYFRRGGEALLEIAPKRNAMLHSWIGVDGRDPRERVRLLRWRINETEYEEPHMVSDEWLDELISQIRTLRKGLVSSRPPLPAP
ncbi:hypothetical protein AB4Z42_06975 [Mycobacterium sp. 2YAF39]|uniref:hypothetical protein n=1 Tax=Mycobacterium sp. 2YAF39 TaxID=3233033 RepID=UPI003F9B5F59